MAVNEMSCGAHGLRIAYAKRRRSEQSWNASESTCPRRVENAPEDVSSCEPSEGADEDIVTPSLSCPRLAAG
jgi:hypothetical protein